MNIEFYYNKSDERQIFKELITGITLSGQLRDTSSLISPVFLIESSKVVNYNFCYIAEWKRYYFVRNITVIRTGLYVIELETDVLMSFKNDIVNFQVVVDKQSMDVNSDEYIDDSSLVCDNIMFNRIYNFSTGFNNSPEYILITAG